MTNARSNRLTLLVAGCIFFSGAASLGLEVVWSRLLRLVFGSTTLAVTTILVAYMSGLGIGGLLGGRWSRRIRDGVRAYGLMEIAVGLYALLVPVLLGLYPELNRLLLASIGFWPAAVVRFLLVLLVLLVPTVLMGATLPILVGALARSGAELGRKTALLYGVNTLGAVAGVLAVTFVSFDRLGVASTNTLAAVVDIVVGLVAVFVLSRRVGAADAPDKEPEPEPRSKPERRRWSPYLVAYGLVGFTALAYEVAWTRAFAMVLGSSTYAFATMLAGFLAGIGLGSLAARPWLDRLQRPRRAFAGGLVLLGLSSLGVLFALSRLPQLFLEVFASVGISGEALVWTGLATSFAIMLVPTLTLGALFPLLVRIVGEDRASGAAVGDVYFVNTIGSALGAFTAGFVAIPLLGLQGTMVGAVALNLATAAFVLARLRREEGGSPLPLSLAAAGAVALLVFPPPLDTEQLSLGVYYRSRSQLDLGLEEIPMQGEVAAKTLYYEEGINCTVSVHRTAGGVEEGGVSLRLNGKTDASLLDMSTQILSGHLPYLFGAGRGDAMVIGYASGVTTGAATLWAPSHLDVVEIEPAVIEASHFFDEVNHRPLEHPDVELVLDDGRTYLTYTRRTYDVIVSEPSNPWISGCSNLFTAEFFRAVRGRLSQDGVLLQWIQLYGIDDAGLQSILAALYESFDHAYGFLFDAGSTDLMLVASAEPIGVGDLARWEDLPPAVRDDLSRLGIYSTAQFLSLAFLDSEALRDLAETAPTVNSDDNMFVELSAPWHLYDDTLGAPPVFEDLLLPASRGLVELVASDPELGSDELLAELAISYLEDRLVPTLADAADEVLLARGAEVWSDVYRAERGLAAGGAPTEALARLNRAVTAAPDAFLPRYRRGYLSFRAEQYAQALGDLERALELRPDHLDARYQRMQCLVATGELDEAAVLAEELVRSPLAETEWGLVAETAYFAHREGDLDRAIERMGEFLRLEPYSPRQWSTLADWLAAAGRIPEERLARENAELAFENDVRRYRWIARWHERFGDPEDALPALAEAARRDPSDAELRAELEQLEARVGAAEGL